MAVNVPRKSRRDQGRTLRCVSMHTTSTPGNWGANAAIRIQRGDGRPMNRQSLCMLSALAASPFLSRCLLPIEPFPASLSVPHHDWRFTTVAARQARPAARSSCADRSPQRPGRGARRAPAAATYVPGRPRVPATTQRCWEILRCATLAREDSGHVRQETAIRRRPDLY